MTAARTSCRRNRWWRVCGVHGSLFGLTFLLLSSNAKCDSLLHAGTHYSGRIVRATASQTFVQVSCDPHRLIALDKASIEFLEFGPECERPSATPEAESTPTCSSPIRGFDATVAGLSARAFIKDFEFSSPTTILLRYHDQSTLVVEQGRVLRLSSVVRCGIDAAVPHAPGPFAAGFCYEPRAWAVAFTGMPVSRNQIFTQGFSIYVAVGDHQRGAMPDIREAFGHALTLWTSALQRIRDELEPDLKSFIDRSISRSTSGGYTLLTPPQAVRRYCKETATFEVRWVTTRELAFPEEDQHVLAKAQFQGRTVFVNAIDHIYSLDLKAVRGEDGTHSLVSIMTHELGHAFGIGHDSVSVASVMRPSASTMSRDPTDDDARQLARVLLQEITGRAPGEVSFSACEGLSAR